MPFRFSNYYMNFILSFKTNTKKKVYIITRTLVLAVIIQNAFLTSQVDVYSFFCEMIMSRNNHQWRWRCVTLTQKDCEIFNRDYYNGDIDNGRISMGRCSSGEHLMSLLGWQWLERNRREVFLCVLANEKLTGISFPFSAKSFLIYVS